MLFHPPQIEPDPVPHVLEIAQGGHHRQSLAKHKDLVTQHPPMINRLGHENRRHDAVNNANTLDPTQEINHGLCPVVGRIFLRDASQRQAGKRDDHQDMFKPLCWRKTGVLNVFLFPSHHLSPALCDRRTR